MRELAVAIGGEICLAGDTRRGEGEGDDTGVFLGVLISSSEKARARRRGADFDDPDFLTGKVSSSSLLGGSCRAEIIVDGFSI